MFLSYLHFIIKTNHNQETLNFILKLSSGEMSKKTIFVRIRYI